MRGYRGGVPATFVKTAPSGERLDQEAAGLRWLADAEQAGGTRIARILGLTHNRLELEYIAEVSATRESARRLGASLARTHAAGAGWFSAADGKRQRRYFIEA